MHPHSEPPILRVLKAALLCWLAASPAAAPQGESIFAMPSDGHGQVVVVWKSGSLGGPDGARGSTDGEAVMHGVADPTSQAFRDPESGRFVEPAPDQLLDTGPRRLIESLSTSSEGLVEEPVAASPGGVRVSLRGRFRSLVTAERRSDGTIASECGEAASGAAGVTRQPSPAPSAPGGGVQ